MSSRLYLECYSGISGDMTVGALLDLGASEIVLSNAIKSLNLEGVGIEINRIKKHGIEGCDFNVILDEVHENHDHDMEYLYGENNFNNKEESTSHHGCHRGLKEVIDIIDSSNITKNSKRIAHKIFKKLAEAEAKAHGTSIDNVHFHEVGAIDSIIDIISVAVCLDNLNITEVIVPVLYEGRGFVRCQHGMLPIPVPAVTNIVENDGLNLHITDFEGELVTPTGAAIVAATITHHKLPEKFTIKGVGIGLGKRKYERPNILRAMLIEDNSKNKDYVFKLESNIDDCSGEQLGYVMDKLFEAGAKDVHYIPVYMKKNRPAYELNVICDEKDIEKIEEIIFKQTTTIGIRKVQMDRTILKREIKVIKTSLGEAQVKVCMLSSGERAYPEYSSVIEICNKYNISYLEAYNIIRNQFNL